MGPKRRLACQAVSKAMAALSAPPSPASLSTQSSLVVEVVGRLVGLLVAVASLCTCGLAALVAVPMSSFYLQNAAYHRGVIR